MIFIAYNFFKYRSYTEKNLSYKKFVIENINIHFPNESYVLPYSQYTVSELANVINCKISDLKGNFTDDLEFIMSRCHKLLFFPTDNLFIGSGMYLEICCAKKYNLPIFCYNKLQNKFTIDFELKNSGFILDPVINNTFYKKVNFI